MSRSRWASLQEVSQDDSWVAEKYNSEPCGKLSADIVGGADQAVLSQGAAKEGQLAETDGSGLALYPSSGHDGSVR